MTRDRSSSPDWRGFQPQPILIGQLLELRPLRPDDFADLYAVASDPLIWQQHPENRHEESVFAEFFRQSLASGGALLALASESSSVIGSSRFHGFNAEAREVEIGWTFLARSCWGGRYNGEMKSLMLNHAFKFVESVLFMIDIENLRSQRAIEKIGGTLTGRRDERGNLIYQITKSSWRS